MMSAAQSSSLQRAGSASSTGSRVQTDHLSACKSPTIVVDSDLVARLSSSSSSSVHAAGARLSSSSSSSVHAAGGARLSSSSSSSVHAGAARLSSSSSSVHAAGGARLSSSSSSSVHAAGADNAVGEPRAMRRIFADDADWTLSTVPDLVELTIRHIVANFASQYTRARSSSSLT